jgi:hypothetical protein
VSQLSQLVPPSLPNLEVHLDAVRGVSFRGTIALKDPGVALGHFMRAVHDAALADGVAQLRVDVTALTFVNSSAIRLFVDWAQWLKAVDPEKRYMLHFITDPQITWQKTSFVALRSLARDVLSVEAIH